uniref:C2H2-type domain-containing protein n=1 Tax=viral metagenome TaxID=1070528 RepID=A0A6M3J5X3_9ZZZZ
MTCDKCKADAHASLCCAFCGKVFARCAACNVHPRTVHASMRAHMAVCHREYDKGRRKLPNKEWM